MSWFIHPMACLTLNIQQSLTVGSKTNNQTYPYNSVIAHFRSVTPRCAYSVYWFTKITAQLKNNNNNDDVETAGPISRLQKNEQQGSNSQTFSRQIFKFFVTYRAVFLNIHPCTVVQPLPDIRTLKHKNVIFQFLNTGLLRYLAIFCPDIEVYIIE